MSVTRRPALVSEARLGLDHLNKLLGWLATTGDFQQEVKRLRQWHDFWLCGEPTSISDDLSQVIIFAGWFEEASMQALSKYTVNVEKFLKESIDKEFKSENGKKGKLCSKQPIQSIDWI